MRTFNRLFSRWLTDISAIAYLPLLIAVSSQAQPAIAQPQLSWQDVVNTIFGRKEPRAPGPGGRGGPRPADLCLVTPVDSVWHTRPLFVWSGITHIVGVRLADTETTLWRKAAFADKQPMNQLEYTGQPLEPGRTYEWTFFFDKNSKSPMLWVPFKVLDNNKRAAIVKDLQTLESRLKAQNSSEEMISLQRANYFSEKGLKADALQEIYSVKHPSIELKQVMQDIEKKACQSQK